MDGKRLSCIFQQNSIANTGRCTKPLAASPKIGVRFELHVPCLVQNFSEAVNSGLSELASDYICRTIEQNLAFLVKTNGQFTPAHSKACLDDKRFFTEKNL